VYNNNTILATNKHPLKQTVPFKTFPSTVQVGPMLFKFVSEGIPTERNLGGVATYGFGDYLISEVKGLHSLKLTVES